MEKLALMAALAATTTACYAQEDHSPTAHASQHRWTDYIEKLCECEDIDNGNMEELYTTLAELDDNPIDLNTATDDDLRRLVFLNSDQLEELTELLDRYRPLRSIGELAMIESIDPLRLELLSCFTYVGAAKEEKHYPTLRNIMKYGKNEIVATAKVPFYDRKGDKNGYLGYKYKHWLRYKFSYGQYLQVGITGTQDAGEPFFSNKNTAGYDHYAFYAIIRKLKAVKALAIGQYKARFALGLVANTGFTFGKTTTSVMSYPTYSITPNASRSEGNYLQGAAATISANRHTDITAFASIRKIDATLNDDGTIKTILKSGYHRTTSELNRKQNASQWAFGGNVRWHAGGWHAGASGIYTALDRTIATNNNILYTRYNANGNRFYNASVDYGYIRHNVNINGETAINNENALATLNSVSVKVSQWLTITALQRYYSYRYYSLLGASFSDGGRVQNESGVYLGILASPLPRMAVTAYCDFAYFPWARYGVSESSHSIDNFIQATYDITTHLSLMGRYRLKIKEEDYTDKATDVRNLIQKHEHRARLCVKYDNDTFYSKSQIDAAYTIYPESATDKSNSFGWMVSHTMGYNGRILSASVFAAYFSTHDYNSRLYAYERGTLYTFSFPMYYGRGMRLAFYSNTKINKNLMLIAKIGTTKYFDREKISSSYQEINGSSQTDLDVQLKWKF